MRILFVTEKVPFNQGSDDQSRAYQQVKGLIEEGNHVDCIFFHEEFIYWLPSSDLLNGSFNTSSIKVHKREHRNYHTYLDLIKGLPLSVSKFSSPQLTEIIRNLLVKEPYDVIHIQSKLAHNLKVTEGFPRIIVDYVGINSLSLAEKMERTTMAFKKRIVTEELRRMKRHEQFLQTIFKRGIVPSKIDCDALSNELTNSLKVVPTPLDLPVTLLRASRRNAIVYSGAMNLPHNVDTAKRLIEKIYLPLKVEIEDLECWIVGGGITPELVKYEKWDGVTITGFVKDIVPWIRNGSVYVSPIEFGTGHHQQLLEVATQVRPIILSEYANQKIGFTNNKEALICKSDEEFIAKVKDVLTNSTLNNRLSRNGKKYVKRKYSQDLAIRLLTAIYVHSEDDVDSKHNESTNILLAEEMSEEKISS